MVVSGLRRYMSAPTERRKSEDLSPLVVGGFTLTATERTSTFGRYRPQSTSGGVSRGLCQTPGVKQEGFQGPKRLRII